MSEVRTHGGAVSQSILPVCSRVRAVSILGAMGLFTETVFQSNRAVSTLSFFVRTFLCAIGRMK